MNSNGLDTNAPSPGKRPAMFDIYTASNDVLDTLATHVDRKQVRAINYDNFLERQLPPRQTLLAPWLPMRGLAMIHAPRGIGKTHIALGTAWAVAAGTGFLRWKVPEDVGTHRVLLLDGEMPGVLLQERLSRVVKASGEKPPLPEYLRISAADLYRDGLPDLASPDAQQFYADVIVDADLVIVDNLSTLCRGLKENEADSWTPVQNWLLAQRRANKSVLVIHHGGKSGMQRGPRKEDVLDTVSAYANRLIIRPTRARDLRFISRRRVAFMARKQNPSRRGLSGGCGRNPRSNQATTSLPHMPCVNRGCPFGRSPSALDCQNRASSDASKEALNERREVSHGTVLRRVPWDSTIRGSFGTIGTSGTAPCSYRPSYPHWIMAAPQRGRSWPDYEPPPRCHNPGRCCAGNPRCQTNWRAGSRGSYWRPIVNCYSAELSTVRKGHLNRPGKSSCDRRHAPPSPTAFSQGNDPAWQAVWYVRVGKGAPRIRIRAEFGTADFTAEYEAALSGTPRTKKGAPSPGTLAWLVDRYRETTAWSSLSPHHPQETR